MPKGVSGGQNGRLLPKPPICPFKLCMCPTFLALPFTIKHEGKKRIMETQIFHHAKI